MEISETEMISATVEDEDMVYYTGNKNYELSNHLGNVLTVITDNKIPIESGVIAGEIDYYLAEIVSIKDYYPFGVEMKERSITLSDKYRYGFNNMERDDETETSDFGARMLDEDLGVWLSIDRLWNLNLGISPYVFANNSVLFYLDSDGNTITPVTNKDKAAYNSSIMTTFKDNEVVQKILTISENNGSLSNLTPEQYEAGMNSLNNIDQKAAFRGLYLAANNEYDIKISVINNYETVKDGSVEQSSQNYCPHIVISDFNCDIKVDAYLPNPEGGGLITGKTVIKTVFDNKTQEYTEYAPYKTQITSSAVILGGIIGAYVQLTNNPITDDNVTYKTITMQSMNLIQSSETGGEKFTGQGFVTGLNNSWLSETEMLKVRQVPEVLRYTTSHFTFGIFKVDLLSPENNSHVSPNPAEQHDTSDMNPNPTP